MSYPRPIEMSDSASKRRAWEARVGLGDDERTRSATDRGADGSSGGHGVRWLRRRRCWDLTCTAGRPAAAAVPGGRWRWTDPQGPGSSLQPSRRTTVSGSTRWSWSEPSTADFGPTLAIEALSRGTASRWAGRRLRTWMVEAGLCGCRASSARPSISRGFGARATASWCRSTAASTAGSRTAASPARCWSSSTMRPAG